MDKNKGKDAVPLVGFIGGYLIDAGVLKLPDLDRALERQLRLGAQGRIVRLDDVLLELHLVTEDDLLRAVARQAADLRKLREKQRGQAQNEPKRKRKGS